jgi:hypothetical protein
MKLVFSPPKPRHHFSRFSHSFTYVVAFGLMTDAVEAKKIV